MTVVSGVMLTLRLSSTKKKKQLCNFQNNNFKKMENKLVFNYFINISFIEFL